MIFDRARANFRLRHYRSRPQLQAVSTHYVVSAKKWQTPFLLTFCGPNLSALFLGRYVPVFDPVSLSIEHDGIRGTVCISLIKIVGILSL